MYLYYKPKKMQTNSTANTYNCKKLSSEYQRVKQFYTDFLKIKLQ